MAPSLNFPRTQKVRPTKITGISVPGALQLRSGSGIVKTRDIITAGRVWSETYDMLKAGDTDVEAFLSFVRRAWHQGEFFNIKHLMTPGSGLDPNGTGSGGVTVNGAGQTGETLATTGWPTSTSNVVRKGDLIRIGGLGATREIYEDANSDGTGNATLNINPPIFTGDAPANGAAITTTNVDIYATLTQQPDIPDFTNSFYYSGITLKFVEVPNA